MSVCAHVCVFVYVHMRLLLFLHYSTWHMCVRAFVYWCGTDAQPLAADYLPQTDHSSSQATGDPVGILINLDC